MCHNFFLENARKFIFCFNIIIEKIADYPFPFSIYVFLFSLLQKYDYFIPYGQLFPLHG